MKGALLICLLFVVAAFASDVIDLDDSNFEQYVHSDINAFVEFFAPWCGHCKSLAPEYEILGTAYKKSAKDVTIGKVDCTEHADLCSKYGVTGYPTLKWFGKGASEPEPYTGERTAAGIIEFINYETGLKVRPPGKPVSFVVDLKESNFDSFVNTNTNAFVEFYAPWCGHCKRLAPEYEKFAAVFQSDDVVIAKVDCTENGELCSKFGVSGYPTLKWFSKGESEPVNYEEDRELSALVSFVNENTGLQRLESGRLNNEVGLIEELDQLIDEYFTGDKTGVLAKAQAVVEKIGTSLEAKTYLRIFEKLANDAEYVTKEIARIGKILQGSLQPAKIDEFTKRTNILNKFIRD